MNSNSRLSCAIAAILSGNAASVAYAAAASDSDVSADQIQEITVTAQRRSENMQDVPITMQALTAETLTQLNVETLDDFIKYLPNVTAATTGPGQGNIYMRGLASTPDNIQGTGGTGSFPNVAIYLDEQSGQMPGRNLDVYAADLERIEVLEGPQGTLFGAGAQAGVLRYITNKPKLDVTEGDVNAGYSYTSHGDPSSGVDAMINLPVIQDTFAVRAVVYSDSRGGYINNVPGTFVRQSSDIGIHYAGYVNNIPGAATPTNSANNNALAANAINPVTYQGFRLSGLYKFNDDWNALLAQSYQTMDAQGVFYETPTTSGVPAQPLPDLSVQLYTPSYNKDRFEDTALTINGRIGELKLVYAGAYMVRHIEQQQDYTAYTRGVYADYYQCISPQQSGKPAQCYSPVSTWQTEQTNTHDSQELRLSTPDDWRLRGIVGLFWEDYKIAETVDWTYKTAPGFTSIGPPAGTDVVNPNLRADDVAFFDDITRGYKQKAAFGSTDFEIIPKTLTATLGTRYYRIQSTATGFTGVSFGCYEDGPPPCTGNASFNSNLTAEGLNQTYSGFRSRFNLSWKIADDILVYYTWSQGFRPGGFNRSSSLHLNNTYATPLSFAPDTLTNNEVGWKTQWIDHRLQFNGAVYQEDWKNVQVQFFDPEAGLGNLNFTANGPDYRVRGVETQLIARVTSGLTITGSAAWNSSDLVNSPYLIGVNGQPITSIPNPYGQTGSPLAQSPPFEGNLRARYEFAVNDYKAFLQIGGNHQDLFSGYGQFVTAETVNRPRIVGLRYSYKF
jgi:outer membrane receptor protein involved in Fe transport